VRRTRTMETMNNFLCLCLLHQLSIVWIALEYHFHVGQTYRVSHKMCKMRHVQSAKKPQTASICAVYFAF